MLRIEAGKLRPVVATRERRFLAVLVVSLLISGIYATALRLPVWRNRLALHEATFKDSPPSGRILQNYASALARSGRHAEALPLLRALVEQSDPRLADADLALAEQGYGLALIVTGRRDEGLTHSLKALNMQPNNPETLANIGFYYGLQGDSAKASEFYAKAIAANSFDPVLHKNYGLALRQLGKLNEASEAYREALKLDPSYIEASRLLTECERRKDLRHE